MRKKNKKSKKSKNFQMHNEDQYLNYKYSTSNYFYPKNTYNINYNYNYKKSSQKVSILLLGATGDGKSQLGNFILNNPKAFKVSDDIKSETKETEGKYGVKGAEDIFVIDTPGLQDTEGKDKYILGQISKYIKNHKSLNAIAIVLNFEVDRLSAYIQEMLKIFVKMFPIPNFWEHVCFVFTHYYSEMRKENEKKKPNKIEKFSELIIELMNNFKKVVNDIQIPNKSNLKFYFVDTEMENIDDVDQNSVEEINRLVGWASNLETFETEKIEKVDNKVVDVRYETKKRKINSIKIKNIETIYYVVERRKIEKLYCGKESFNPWIEIKRYCENIYHEPEIIRTEKKWTKRESSKFFRNIENKTIKYYYKIINIYDNDTIEESDWFYSHEEKDKIVHPKKLINSKTEYKETKEEKTNKAKTITTYYTFTWSRIKKSFNDLSVEYTDWKLINTITKTVKRPPYIIKTKVETKTLREYQPIIETRSKEVFDYLLIIIPMYKTVYYNKTIGRKVFEKTYTRKIEYYSDNTVNYGDWKYKDTDIYNEYY